MKVSINIVTHNRSGLLKRAIESVLKQDYSDIELVVVDDGSHDETAKVVLEFQNRVGLKFYRFEKNVGVVKARQKALELSEGDLVAVLDDDDEWIDSRKLTLQVGKFIHNPKLVLVGCYGEMQDEGTGKIYLWTPPCSDKDIRRQMLFRNSFMHPAMMYKRMLALKAGGYSDDIKYAEDYALVLKLGLMGETEIIPEYMMRFRVNHDGLTSFNNLKQIQSGIKLVWSFKDNYPGVYLALLKWSVHFLFVYLLGHKRWFRVTKWRMKGEKW